jgi:hypothetical protein
MIMPIHIKNKEKGKSVRDKLNKNIDDTSAKVDKIAGKGLSENDFTTAEKNKLNNIENNANNYEHPANHDPSIISQDTNNRFVTDAEKGTWNNKKDKLITILEITGNHDLVLTDASKQLSLIDNGDQQVVVPANATEDIPIGSEFVIQGIGIGTKTISSAVGVDINGVTTDFVLDSQYASAVLRKIGEDEWLIIGAVN